LVEKEELKVWKRIFGLTIGDKVRILRNVIIYTFRIPQEPDDLGPSPHKVIEKGDIGTVRVILPDNLFTVYIPKRYYTYIFNVEEIEIVGEESAESS